MDGFQYVIPGLEQFFQSEPQPVTSNSSKEKAQGKADIKDNSESQNLESEPE